MKAHPNDLTLARLPLQSLYLQIRSHPEVLEVRISTYDFGGNTIQPIHSTAQDFSGLRSSHSFHHQLLTLANLAVYYSWAKKLETRLTKKHSFASLKPREDNQQVLEFQTKILEGHTNAKLQIL